MQNLAFQLEFTFDDQATPAPPRDGRDHSDLCFACGDKLFGPDADACSWQSWEVLWKILGMRNGELLCGGCGADRHDVFSTNASRLSIPE